MLLCLLCGKPEVVQAKLVASEEFDYAQVDHITDARGGTGWEDAWTGSSFITVGSLAFPGLANRGHKLTTSGAEGGTEDVKCSFRTLSIQGREDLVDEGRFGKDHTTLWIAFVVNAPSGLSAGFGGLSLYDGPRQRLFLGDTGTSNVWGMDVGRWTHRFSDTPADRNPCLLVYRITFLPGDEKIDMWVNPAPGREPPPESSIAASASAVPDFRFNRVRLCSAPAPLNFDALRIGTTFTDVAPAVSAAAAVPDAPAAPPPPQRSVTAARVLVLLVLAGSGLTLLALVVLVGLLWHRRRLKPPRVNP